MEMSPGMGRQQHYRPYAVNSHQLAGSTNIIGLQVGSEYCHQAYNNLAFSSQDHHRTALNNNFNGAAAAAATCQSNNNYPIINMVRGPNCDQALMPNFYEPIAPMRLPSNGQPMVAQTLDRPKFNHVPASPKSNIINSNTKKNSNNNQNKSRPVLKQRSHLVSFKSRLGVEYRRFAVPKDEIIKFEDFYQKVRSMHRLDETPFTIFYSDQDGELLPINNDDNLAKAFHATAMLETVKNNADKIPKNRVFDTESYYINTTHNQQVINERPYLRLFLEREGVPNQFRGLTLKSKKKENLINMFIPNSSSSESRPRIGMPEDFRQVSAIIDADKLPAGRRRVVLNRGSKDQDKPLGFYIRDGIYQKMNAQGEIEKIHGIFISRIVPGGLADTTNLLAENDEIIEVNGIEIGGSKRLDQVRDMMVANSSNLIITIRPAKLASFLSRSNNRDMKFIKQTDTCRDRGHTTVR